MDAGMTSFRSILEKPLKELTEDDISQLTREDCRNFLKLKGMRRPSWNKSQAIQQVVSLKALFESTEDSGASALRKITANPLKVVSNSADSVKEASEVGKNAGTGDGCSPFRRNDPLWPIDADTNMVSQSPRSPHDTNEPDGQMTIFYCGKVNVYEGVPPDKARDIMQLAAVPVYLPQYDSINRTTVPFSFPCRLQSAGEQNGLSPSSAIMSQSMQGGKLTEYSHQFRDKGNTSHVLDAEAASRKVSLQRYREKRKDRGRYKLRKGDAGLTSPCMEMYSTHQAWIPISNAQLSRSKASSPTQHRMPNMPYNSADRQENIAGLSVDLNDTDVEEL